jgi:hypothetical protein
MAELNSTEFKTVTADLYADNIIGNIGANDLRTQMDNVADSTVFKFTGNTTTPGVNDDSVDTSGNGVFQVGDVWINELADSAFICVDNTPTAAIWNPITTTLLNAVSRTGPVPGDNQVAVWANTTQIEGRGTLTYDGSILNVTGNLTLSGTVDGRDLGIDGSKLDLIAPSSTKGVSISNSVIGGATSVYAEITNLTFASGTGLSITNPTAGNATITPQVSITQDLADRTLALTDHGSYISNSGAPDAVRWAIPTSLGSPMVVTFFKTANQLMELIGFIGVTINGATETGSSESLQRLCPSNYTSFVTLVRTATDTYTLYNGSVDKLGTPGNNQIAVWTEDGIIEGSGSLTWNEGTLGVTGGIRYRYDFDTQIGTSHTLVFEDSSQIVTMDNAAANSVTIPTFAAAGIPVGGQITIIQLGVGATSLVADTGVTLNGVLAGTGAMTSQWGEIRLYQRTADIWYVTGDIGVVA